ncbi:TetR/AcrR family transcriptional regulator [Flavobacteriaceae bacterium]|jgi:AcrR family transcriptional regulator|nr:TetR/AcrR family transcriptional regulator [Flavobacteriaceae bacterium]MDC0957250.1 TetR/AcrR family transcriptional regulator [Flavobacteriaceae bacterium]MDG1379487.1 TetR/AcrR family transcriptional regulator [Flavobacteriaceae bacterium]MDG2349963.1 TetR/AcrR family transcriptional regulator [Flavobacteriaceae bacterium]|tara:strand:- start:144 stop:818 length:675 start_codon:yes stop_codon:yes gene_type:complete
MFILTDMSIPKGLSLRDPLQSKLGKSIITNSIILIDEIGFESFTFKKLALKMQSNETSLYRYFENKHFILLYLVVWYWNWVSYLIDYNTKNITDSNKKLNIIIDNFVDATKENPSIDFVNEKLLHRIIIAESAKAYHTKNIDEENKQGFYKSYKSLIQKVADVILDINPEFPYPHSLANNLFEMANNEIFFAEHLPRLTDMKVSNENYEQVNKLLKYYKSKMLD